MNIDKSDTAVVFIDPQNEVLSERGLAWPLVHESLQENNTIENMERIFKAAKAHGFEVFISPHYFYLTGGSLESDEAVAQVEGHSGEKIQVHVRDAHSERMIDGTDLLVATGRTPNTDAIGLEHAGVELNDHGYIKVNDRLETTAGNVWAMGDCAGSPQFTQFAYNDFRVVHENLNGGNRTTKDRLVPFCIFTDPELARIVRNESEAWRDRIQYRVAKMPMADVLRTRTVSEPRGFMKMLVGKDSDEIIGFTAFGVEGSELMAAVQTAMVGQMPFTMLRDAIFTDPTISEGLVFLLGQIEGHKD